MSQYDHEFLAVQEDPGAFWMDWPVFDEQDTSGAARGTLFVLDAEGRRVTSAPLADSRGRLGRSGTPDDAADGALESIGWMRTGPWVADGFGRHSAPVVAVAAREPIPAQSRRSPSLAEEAAFHLG